MIPYLGMLAAEDKLERNDLLDHAFVMTDRVREALRSGVLFVCGRKGSGKTAVIHHLRSDPDSSHDFTSVLKDTDYQSLHLHLAADIVERFHVGASGYQIIIDTYARIWQYLLEVAVIYSLHHEIVRGNLEGPRPAIANFVKSTGASSPCLHVQKTIEELLLRSRNELSRTVFVNSVLGLLEGDKFLEARLEAQSILKKRSLLLMIDTMEQYNIADTGLYPFQGLCSAIRQFENHHPYDHLTVKCFLPAEMTEHLFGQNRAKFLEVSVFLSWSYSELVEFVGMRYAHYLLKHVGTAAAREHAKRVQDGAQKTASEPGPRNQRGRDLIWRLIAPERVPNRLGSTEDSCAYTLRHTQKRPREVLCCMNHVLMKANGDSTVASALRITPEHLVAGIHTPENLQKLINDTLASFSIPLEREKASDVTRRILNNEPRIFPYRDLRRMLKRAFMNQELMSVEHVQQLDTRTLVAEIRRMLLRSGLIGEIEREATVSHPENRFVKYYCTRFEYVYPGLLQPNEESRCAMHPMLADYLKARDPNNPPGIVYHLPEEEELETGLQAG